MSMQEKAERLLLGKRITKIEWMSKEETKTILWNYSPVCIQLEDGTWIIPQSDDEGNEAGVLTISVPKKNHDHDFLVLGVERRLNNSANNS